MAILSKKVLVLDRSSGMLYIQYIKDLETWFFKLESEKSLKQFWLK
jgi:hypothetical protein